MRKLFYRSGVTVVIVMLAVALTLCFAFADTAGAEPEAPAPATVPDLDDLLRELGLTDMAPNPDTTLPIVIANGEVLILAEAAPFVRNGAMMVPVRAVADAMGADVRYDGKTKEITVDTENASVAFTVGGQTAVSAKDGQTTEIELLVAPFIDNASASSYVPLRALAESLGFELYWDDSYKIAEIIDKEAVTAEIDAQFTVFNALYRNMREETFSQFISDEATRTDLNYTIKLNARYPRYDSDYDAYDSSNVPESDLKFEAALKMLCDRNGIDMTGDMSVETNGFENIWPQDPETRALLDDMKKGVPFDVLINYAGDAIYLHLPILSRAEPLLSNTAWIEFRTDRDRDADFQELTDMVNMIKEEIENPENPENLTFGNMLYGFASYYYSNRVSRASVYGYPHVLILSDFSRVTYARDAAEILALFLGDEYMAKSGDVYAISLNRLELFNVFRKLANNGNRYMRSIGVYDYSEFLSRLPVANYTMLITEKDNAPDSIELAANVKFKPDDYYDEEASYIELHCNLAMDAVKTSVDYSLVAEENAGLAESLSLSVHADTVNMPTDETPRTKPPAGVEIISSDEL
jgi:hypothetical protein